MMLSLGQQLQGKVELFYEPGGFIYRMDVPLEAVTIKPASRGQGSAA